MPGTWSLRKPGDCSASSVARIRACRSSRPTRTAGLRRAAGPPRCRLRSLMTSYLYLGRARVRAGRGFGRNTGVINGGAVFEIRYNIWSKCVDHCDTSCRDVRHLGDVSATLCKSAKGRSGLSVRSLGAEYSEWPSTYAAAFRRACIRKRTKGERRRSAVA
jgi:hypothetical protein